MNTKFFFAAFFLNVFGSSCLAQDIPLKDFTLYRKSDYLGHTILAIPSVEINLPKTPNEEFYSIDVSDQLQVTFMQIGAVPRGHLRSVHLDLPNVIKEPIKSLFSAGQLLDLTKSNWGYQFINDFGLIEIPIGKGKPIFTAPAGVQIRAITPQLSDGLLAAIAVGSGRNNKLIAGIDVAHSAIIWQFPVTDLYADTGVAWISPDLLLSTMYGRGFSECGVVDIKTHKIITQHSAKVGVRYIIKDSSVVGFDTNDGTFTKIFPME